MYSIEIKFRDETQPSQKIPMGDGIDLLSAVEKMLTEDAHLEIRPVLSTENSITVSGKTTLYGEVVSIGGESIPHVALRLLNGSLGYYRVATLGIAQKLGERIYTRVGVRGTAEWTTTDFTLIDFVVEEMTEYRDIPLPDALASLRELTHDAYGQVADIEALIDDLRGRDE
jgi:hypothetical protein